jgi:hypothetical protein
MEASLRPSKPPRWPGGGAEILKDVKQAQSRQGGKQHHRPGVSRGAALLETGGVHRGRIGLGCFYRFYCFLS